VAWSQLELRFHTCNVNYSLSEHDAKEQTIMRVNPLNGPNDMVSLGRSTERFDDGLVHNHHWAVTADEAYPAQRHNAVFEASPGHSAGTTELTHDHHDDGLVHNHHWAVSGQ
jgi:hypothetical protein